jgi:ribosome-associated protein
MERLTKAEQGSESASDFWLVVTSRIRIPMGELKFTFSRSSGPGGQNVNKVNTKAQLRWNLAESSALNEDVKQRLSQQYKRRVTTDGDVLITSQRYRDQSRNASDCLDKLREMVVEAARRPKARKATKPPRRAKEKRLKQKRHRSERKQQRKPPADH